MGAGTNNPYDEITSKISCNLIVELLEKCVNYKYIIN